jgi:hypothetical protein
LQRSRCLPEIAQTTITVLGQLPTPQLALNDHLEPRPLKMERLHAPLRHRQLVEEALEDAPGRHGGFSIRHFS